MSPVTSLNTLHTRDITYKWKINGFNGFVYSPTQGCFKCSSRSLKTKVMCLKIPSGLPKQQQTNASTCILFIKNQQWTFWQFLFEDKKKMTKTGDGLWKRMPPFTKEGIFLHCPRTKCCEATGRKVSLTFHLQSKLPKV